MSKTCTSYLVRSRSCTLSPIVTFHPLTTPLSSPDSSPTISSQLVDDTGSIRVTPNLQHTAGYDKLKAEETGKKVYEVSFGQVYLSKPINVEKDQSPSNIFPHEARLRNLTYSSPLYCDVELNTYDISELDPDRQDVHDLGEPEAKEEATKVFMGYVPIMLRSQFCVLADKNDVELCELGECIYDQGGYFVINGSEKVIVAHERMSNNHVYAFKKKQPHKYSWVVETRSQVENR